MIRKKILITGATGFVGANLARYFLKEGAEIYIFSRKISDKWRLKDILGDIHDVAVDLNDVLGLNKNIALIKPDIILHNAVYGGYSYQSDPVKIIETNFIGTFNLLNACKAIDFELFVNSGSSSEYGIKPKPMKETDVLEPVNEYGVSKSAATLLCQLFAKKENRKVITFRLFSPYGYYEEPTRLMPSLILSCLIGQNPKLSSPLPVRDFIFIEDILAAYSKLLTKKDKINNDDIFNIAFGKQHSVGEVVEYVLELTGNKLKPGWGKVDNSRREPKVWQADISKARDLLGWNPKFDLKAGVKKDIKWFMKNIERYNEHKL